MKFRKFVLCVMALLIFAGASFAAESAKPLKLGLLAKLNMTAGDYHRFMAANVTGGAMNIFSNSAKF